MSCTVCEIEKQVSHQNEDAWIRHQIIFENGDPFYWCQYKNIEWFCLSIAKYTNEELMSLRNINNQNLITFICNNSTNIEHTNLMLEILKCRLISN